MTKTLNQIDFVNASVFISLHRDKSLVVPYVYSRKRDTP